MISGKELHPFHNMLLELYYFILVQHCLQGFYLLDDYMLLMKSLDYFTIL